MQKLIAASLLLVAATATSPSATPLRSDPVLVRAVVDGATIDVATVGRVHLLGIEAPRARREDGLGREARDRLASIVLRRWVRLEWDAPPPDARARRAAYVVTETGEFVNAMLVREGLVRVATRGTIGRLSELQRAEAEARTQRRGLYSRVHSSG